MEEISRDGRAKSTQTRLVGIITDEMHPYIVHVQCTSKISSNRVSMKMCRDASRLLLSLLLLVYFLALPSLLISLIYLVAFYTSLCSFL